MAGGRALGVGWGSERSSKPNDGAGLGTRKACDGVRLAAEVSGLGLVLFASKRNPRPEPGMSDLCGHRLGNGRRGGLGLGGGAGLGDAGDEPLGQLGGTLQGAARVTAGVLEGGKGDHEGEDAPSWIAGSDGD